MAAQSGTFDILVNGKKRGFAYDSNPVVINTDHECKECLLRLKSTLDLSNDELELIDTCINVVSSKDGDEVLFGPGEIVLLSLLAEANPSKAPEIMACSHHLSESVDCDGDLPPGIFAGAADAHAALAALMDEALKSGPITSDYPTDDDSITEESLTDEDN